NRWLDLGLATDYYDAGQLVASDACARQQSACEHRDFRTGSATVRLGAGEPHGDGTLIVGYRGFQYKPPPDGSFSFQGVQATLLSAARAQTGSGTHTHEIGLAASYHLERRWFGHDQNNNPQRHDWFHEGNVELSYLGPLLLSTGYGIQLNLSDSDI